MRVDDPFFYTISARILNTDTISFVNVHSSFFFRATLKIMSIYKGATMQDTPTKSALSSSSSSSSSDSEDSGSSSEADSSPISSQKKQNSESPQKKPQFSVTR